jgi:hypothetical protein
MYLIKWSSISMPFEILDRSLVLLRLLSCRERPKVLAPPCLRILMP